MTIYIFVLAGGLKSPDSVNDFVCKRLDITFQLYQKHQHEGCKIICSGGWFFRAKFLKEIVAE